LIVLKGARLYEDRHPNFGRKRMAHNHGNEYQIKIVHKDGTEELSEWMNREQFDQAAGAVHNPQGKTYWLRAQNVLCPNCPDRQQRIVVECPLSYIPSSRLSAHDSRYVVTGARSRFEAA
jgi:hypothetical protein